MTTKTTKTTDLIKFRIQYSTRCTFKKPSRHGGFTLMARNEEEALAKGMRRIYDRNMEVFGVHAVIWQ